MNVGSTAFSYDARGNLTSDGTNAFIYTAENLLKTGPSSATLGYDPLGRLYQTVGGGVTTRFLHDGADLIGEYNGSNAVQRRCVHGPGTDERVVWYEGGAVSNTTRRFLMADERGSVVSVTDSAGTTLGLNSYDEYGIPAPGNIGRFGYTGQAWLPELGLWYYKARIYAPKLGRFMQTDPIGYQDEMNWYNYVGSDPVNFVDPFGLENKKTDDENDGGTIVITAYRSTFSGGLARFGGFGGGRRSRVVASVELPPLVADTDGDGIADGAELTVTAPMSIGAIRGFGSLADTYLYTNGVVGEVAIGWLSPYGGAVFSGVTAQPATAQELKIGCGKG